MDTNKHMVHAGYIPPEIFTQMYKWYRTYGTGYCLRRTHFFGYFTNLVQQIEFLIHTNIKPFPALFFTKVQGYKSNIQKNSC